MAFGFPRYPRRNAMIQMAQSKAEKTAFQLGIDSPAKAQEISSHMISFSRVFVARRSCPDRPLSPAPSPVHELGPSHHFC